MSSVEDFVNSRAKIVLFSAFAASLALHGVAYASLTHRSVAVIAAIPVSTVDFEVTAPPPPEPQAETPLPVAPAARSPAPAPAHAQSVRATPEVAPPESLKAASPALDLSGVTLSNDSGDGFAMPVGDGSVRSGPIGLGGRGVELSARVATREARHPAAPVLVAARDLSEHPRPPALEGLLRANYPEQARQRGLRGSASVRARIDADGVIRSIHVVTESSGGFGSACQHTVQGSRWSAPRAQNGDAVATEIVYTCHFEVD